MVKLYDRDAALSYAKEWALRRNPRYYDFSDIGGDCTNFISQCIYAGSGVMNFTPEVGWYYTSANHRSASWTGVNFLYRFLVTNTKKGPYAKEVAQPGQLIPGDIIQFGNDIKGWHPSLFVIQTGDTYDKVLIATHTYDAYGRQLSSYDFTKIRFLHIAGVYA